MDNLLQNIQDFFLGQYKDLSNTNTFLAFEPLGCIIDPEDYKDPATGQFINAMADEDIAEIVDRVPEISDVFIPGLEQVSRQYEALVAGARFNANAVQNVDNADYIALLGKIRDDAAKTLADADRMSISNASGKYFPATTTPDAWYDTQSPIWAFKEFFAEKLAPETPPATPGVPAHKLSFAWKKVGLGAIAPELDVALDPHAPRRPLLNMMRGLPVFAAAPAAIPGNLMKKAPPPGPIRLMARPGPFARPRATTLGAVASAPAPAAGPPAKMTARRTALLANLGPKASIAVKTNFTRLVLGDSAVTETKPVETNNFHMSFEYCVVQIHRFWFDTKLFNYAKLWYSLAQPAGFFSSGAKDTTNRGCLRAIPKAFIIIKNLKIDAAWSPNDLDAAHSSVGLGFFNLMNSTVNNNKLENPSLQIIGWLCEATPRMPAADDPSLTG